MRTTAIAHYLPDRLPSPPCPLQQSHPTHNAPRNPPAKTVGLPSYLPRGTCLKKFARAAKTRHFSGSRDALFSLPLSCGSALGGR
jgi:hypothetical protein